MMSSRIDPSEFGIKSRVVILNTGNNNFHIVKKRKSRLIMKDGEQIIKIANAIHNKKSSAKISLVILGPICSKTIKYLKDNSINVIHEEQ